MGKILAALAVTALLVAGCSTSTPGTPIAATTTAQTQDQQRTDDQQIAEQARQLVAQAAGQPDGNFAASSSEWAVHITGFTFTDGTLHVAMQLDPDYADRLRIGMVAAMAISNLVRTVGIPTLKSAVKWVETTDSTGTRIAQNKV